MQFFYFSRWEHCFLNWKLSLHGVWRLAVLVDLGLLVAAVDETIHRCSICIIGMISLWHVHTKEKKFTDYIDNLWSIAVVYKCSWYILAAYETIIHSYIKLWHFDEAALRMQLPVHHPACTHRLYRSYSIDLLKYYELMAMNILSEGSGRRKSMELTRSRA